MHTSNSTGLHSFMAWSDSVKGRVFKQVLSDSAASLYFFADGPTSSSLFDGEVVICAEMIQISEGFCSYSISQEVHKVLSDLEEVHASNFNFLRERLIASTSELSSAIAQLSPTIDR